MDNRVAGDVELAVREFGGSGPEVLLLHGAGNTLADMAPLARCLAAHHRVVGMDLRNHGRSGDGPWTWDAVLGDIRVVIERLAMARPLLVGHSLGGMLAALYAHRRGAVAGAVNLDGLGTGSPEQYDMDPDEVIRLLAQLHIMSARTIEASTTPQSVEQVRSARKAWIDGAIALGLDRTDAEEAFCRPLVVAADGAFTRRPAGQQLTELKRHIDNLDMLELYRLTGTPQLVFVAIGDAGLPPELQALSAARSRRMTAQLRLMAQARPNLKVVEIDAGHGLIYERPQLLAAEIRAFAAATSEEQA